ncbi:MAG: competence/damage-inducible protein A [Clostridiales bacterium]|nr:competence/damage-inducible protein A [Clostridiales bacterium]
MPVCELISVGTELLLGEILNTNARFLSLELAAMGISVLRQSTVGDNPKRLALAIEEALSRSDLVIISGGLGPTPDDITKEVACRVLACDLVLSEEISEDLKAFFSARGLDMPKTNEKQALVPKGAKVFKNPKGTAPGLAYEKDGKCLIMLPGPPREMEPMFLESVKPFLSKYSDQIILSHTLRTFGIGESAMAELAGELLNGTNPTVAPYAKDGEALLRVTARAESLEKAEALCKPVLDSLQKKLAPYVYGIDVENLQSQLVLLLEQSALKLATAESCTAGYLSKKITEVPGASKVFECGIVAYSSDIKQSLLAVSADTIKTHGLVSPEVAISMAKGARHLAAADLALGVTGVAGPGPDTQGNPAGLAYIALVAENDIIVEKVQTARSNDRDYNRRIISSRALNIARLYLLELKAKVRE